MTTILHITTLPAWDEALDLGEYRTQSLDTEGFIHCSRADQVVQVAEAFYHDVPELVLLVIDGDALTADLRWEAPAHPATIEPGVINEDQKFPHIYGPLNLDAVLTLVPWARNPDGTFTLPAELRPE